MVRAFPKPITRATERLGLDHVAFCAWVAQAEPDEALEYHRGFLALDRLPALSELGDAEALRLARVAERALHAAEQGLVHLVQRRHGAADFAYLAVARPRPERAASLSQLLLQEAA